MSAFISTKNGIYKTINKHIKKSVCSVLILQSILIKKIGGIEPPIFLARDTPKYNVSEDADFAKGKETRDVKARSKTQKRKTQKAKTQNAKRKNVKRNVKKRVFLSRETSQKAKEPETSRRELKDKNVKRKGQKRKTQNVKT